MFENLFNNNFLIAKCYIAFIFKTVNIIPLRNTQGQILATKVVFLISQPFIAM